MRLHRRADHIIAAEEADSAVAQRILHAEEISVPELDVTGKAIKRRQRRSWSTVAA